MILSSNSNATIEDVAQVNPTGIKLFQIYMSKQESVNKDLWDRCMKNGFHGFAVTCDTQLLGKRRRDVRNGFGLPEYLSVANYDKYGSGDSFAAVDKTAKKVQSSPSAKKSTGSALADFMNNHKENRFSWEVLKYIKKVTRGQAIVAAKGIMCPEDAILALENEADVIYVSNHGARQLDTTPTTIDVLPSIVKAVRAWELGNNKRPGDIQIYFDGGLRNGSSCLKALGLGADLVFVGRPALWALATAGKSGVDWMQEKLAEELLEVMNQCGIQDLRELKTKNIFYANDEILFNAKL